MSSNTQSLTDLSLSAVKWNYIGVVARIVSQLVAQIAIARLLGPESFGLFSVAFIVVGIGILLVEMGLGSALVQKKNLTEEDVRFGFSWIMAAGLVMVVLVFFLADSIAVFFIDPRIAGVIRGLTPVFILQALCVVPMSLLKRELAFRTVQGSQIASYLIGFLLVGVGSALLGAGVWSLVAAWITQTLSAALILNVIKRYPMKPLFYMQDRTLWGFSIRVIFTNIVNWVIENIDNLLVGKIFGPTALGLYSVSYNLVRTPTNHLVVTLQTVLFPASARVQDNQENLRRAYLTVLSGAALISIPVFGGVATVSGTMVEAILGNEWIDAAPVLLPLALAMIFHALMAVAGPVLWGKGAVGTEFKVQFWVALVLAGTMIYAGRYSIVVLAWAVGAVYASRMIGLTIVLMRHIHLPLFRLLRALWGGVLAGAMVMSLLIFFDGALSGFAVGIKFAIEIGVAALALFLFVLVMPRWALSDELLWIVQRLLSKMPCLAQSFLLRRLVSIQSPSAESVAP